jgi:hypothetical protein
VVVIAAEQVTSHGKTSVVTPVWIETVTDGRGDVGLVGSMLSRAAFPLAIPVGSTTRFKRHVCGTNPTEGPAFAGSARPSRRKEHPQYE